MRPPPRSTLFPYTTLFRSRDDLLRARLDHPRLVQAQGVEAKRVLRIVVAPPAVGDVLQRLERSEEHTSELQSHSDLVCRLLLEKKNYNQRHHRQTKHHSHQ